MARASNVIITILNLIFLLVSLVAIGFSVWFRVSSDNQCQRVLQRPLLVVGLALLVMSLLGFIGSCYRLSFFLWMYLAVLFIFILGMLCLTVFTIMVTNKNVGDAFSNKGLKEARLWDFSNWLRNHLVNANNWDHVKSCLVKVQFCHRLSTAEDAEFYKKPLSPTQSGCCKPPTYCGMEFQNATYWLMPKTGPAVPDSDCKTWSNDQTQLCLDCKSCKSAVLDNLKKEWRVLAIANTVVMVTVIIVYSIGCCALRNNRGGSSFKKHKPYP